MLKLEGVAVLVGAYGSGKTEVAVNLALAFNSAGRRVRLADLDLVNPYFRSREVREDLVAAGIDVVLPPERYLNADLPILSPAVAGMIRGPADISIVDVGGDAVGARVLAALAGAFENTPATLIQVVNPYRPFTRTPEGCRRVQREIETAAGLRIGAIIGNANMLQETTPEHIFEGYDFVKQLGAALELPLLCVTADASLSDALDAQRFDCPVLWLRRRLVPPWLESGDPPAAGAGLFKGK